MLSRFDDYCIHQTSEPVAHPSQTDRNFYDRYWFNGFTRDGSIYFGIGFGVYPNRFVMDGHFSVVVDGKQYCFHGSRRAPFDRSETEIGPFSVEVTNPMKEIRVRIEPNDTGIEVDLHFKGKTSPTQEPKSRLVEDIHVILDTCRFTQFGNWEGYIKIDGKKLDLNPDDCLGTRDKSWGVRPVGEPQGGAPGLLNNEPGIYWCWAPVHFADFCTQFGTFEDHDGNPTQVSGCRVPVYPEVDEIPIGSDPGLVEMEKAVHRVKWQRGTRRMQYAELELHTPEGDEMIISLEPVNQFLMLALGYQHPEWGHAFWKGEEAIGREEWAIDDLDPLDYKHIHIHQVVKAKAGNLEGIGTFETIVFGRHDPSGFTDFLDGAE